MANEGNGSPAAFSAGQAIALLEQIETLIPGFEQADPKVWRKIARKGGYPAEYVEAATNVVRASEVVQQATHFDAEAVRGNMSLSVAIRELITRTESLLAGLRFTDAKVRASAVDACDLVYAVAPAVARSDKSLRPHIDAMHHTSRRRGGKKKDQLPPEAPPQT
jgi:hypothetical protein